MSGLSRPEAVDRLAQHGIEAPDIYLLDLLPLIEMIWADGLLQSPEMTLLDEFVADHVTAINQLSGAEILSVAHARRFAWRFLKERPDQRLMAELRSLIPPIRLSSSDADGNDARRRAIIEWCLDIGSACVASYPYGVRERFKSAEKRRFLSILDALTQPRSA